MSDFRAFCESLGLRVSHIAPDGRWHRVPTANKPRRKNGAFKLAPDGRIGWAYDLALHDGPVQWRPDASEAPDTFSPDRLRAAREDAEQRRREQREAIREARAFFDACTPLRNGHEYLTGKQLGMEGAHGLRVDGDGWLVVPAYRNGSLVSYQRISPEGVKRFAYGAPMSGTTYTLERRRSRHHIVCEGLATGLAIYAAMPGSRVVVSFTAGGLAHAAETLPSGFACIASDNDHATVCPPCREEGHTIARDPRGDTPEGCRCNPGIRAALAASSASGAGIAAPVCPDGGTDWCDYRVEERARRLQDWKRRKHETDAVIHRAVDVAIAMELQRAALFRAPTTTED
jgi:putative DNA primase/helicase